MLTFALRNARTFADGVVYLVMGLLAVTIALVLHEVAHGLVAKWNGDYTAKYAGRLSLNPLRHFDLIGFIMMMLVGFGYAKPVPINPNNFKHYRRGLVTVAIAGIVMNLILAFFGILFACLMVFAYNHAALGGSSDGTLRLIGYLQTFFVLFSTINLSLLFFNILPIFPLDGFRVVEAFTHYGNKYCAFMRANGHYILYGLVGLSLIVSAATSRVSLPGWFQYVDVLGTYIDFFTTKVFDLFVSFWQLIVPVY